MKILNTYSHINPKYEPQCKESLTIPGQAPALRYIIGQLMRGEAIHTLDMRYDNNPDFDDPDMPDLRHTTSSDLEAILAQLQTEPSPQDSITENKTETSVVE